MAACLGCVVGARPQIVLESLVGDAAPQRKRPVRVGTLKWAQALGRATGPRNFHGCRKNLAPVLRAHRIIPFVGRFHFHCGFLGICKQQVFAAQARAPAWATAWDKPLVIVDHPGTAAVKERLPTQVRHEPASNLHPWGIYQWPRPRPCPVAPVPSLASAQAAPRPPLPLAHLWCQA